MVDKVLCLAILFMAGAILGCGENNMEASLQTPPTVIDLSKGKVDPKLVGVWKNPGETYTFAKDGTFKMHFDRMEQTGPSATSLARKVGDLSGEWSSTEDSLLLDVEKGENNTKHKMALFLRDGGKTLELRPTFMKQGVGTIYRLQK
jgi:hypothetical protein